MLQAVAVNTKLDSNDNTIPLIIYGLNLSTTSASTLLTLTGTNITITGSTFQGSGNGTAIQVNAPSPQPSPQGGEGVTTIGPDVTIDNFEKGIFIKSGASAKITQNSIKVKSWLITDALSFETPISSAFSESLIGKHLSEADPNYADKFVGQLTGKTTDSCVGSVEILYTEKTTGLAPFNYLAACPVKWIKDEADKVTLKNKEGATTEIGANSCIFECKDMTAAAEYLVTFVYTDGSGVTGDYLPSTPLVSELGDVIFVSSIPAVGPITSGADDTTIVVTGPNEPANFDPGDPKAQTGDANNNDDDGGGQVSQGVSGGCSLIR